MRSVCKRPHELRIRRPTAQWERNMIIQLGSASSTRLTNPDTILHLSGFRGPIQPRPNEMYCQEDRVQKYIRICCCQVSSVLKFLKFMTIYYVTAILVTMLLTFTICYWQPQLFSKSYIHPRKNHSNCIIIIIFENESNKKLATNSFSCIYKIYYNLNCKGRLEQLPTNSTKSFKIRCNLVGKIFLRSRVKP